MKLMGIPYIVALTEAEAQCAVLARAGKVYAAASEDMDTLTFNAPILLRHLTFSEQRKEPIQEIHLDKVLAGLEMEREQFIDLCILLGCDYVDPVKGIGPNTALKLIREHKNLEGVVKYFETSNKYTVPEDWPYQDARVLFLEPEVLSADDEACNFNWEQPDEEGLVKFLVEEKGFNEDRVRNGAMRLKKSSKSSQQSRLDGFFKPVERSKEDQEKLKRKNEEKVAAQKKAKKEQAKEKKEARAKPRGAA